MHDLGKIEAAADSAKSNPGLRRSAQLAKDRNETVRRGGQHVWFG
jgi:hypothetical protein